MTKDSDVPEGKDFLELVWAQEDACEAGTDERIPNLGSKASACLERLGTVLSLLDRMASCWWVCRQGDHRIEYLCGRAASNARAVLRLLRFGFYDEALVLCRGLGEVANLMYLFVCDEESFEEWKTSCPRRIRQEFSPVRVRLRLESLSKPPAINEERYRLLSERAAHVHPGTTPQAHNILGVPVAGAKIQDEGLLICINELAIPLSLITSVGVHMLDIDTTITEQIISCSQSLSEQIGGATITEIETYHRELSEHPMIAKRLAKAEGILRKVQTERKGGLR